YKPGRRGVLTNTWSPKEADEVMRTCVGAAILGLPIWNFQTGNQTGAESEYCHYEGALARAYNLPILALLGEGVEERGFFAPYGSNQPFSVQLQADGTWVSTPDF